MIDGYDPSRGNQTPDATNEISFETMSFERLRAAHQQIERLARTTFRRTADGFANILGDRIDIAESRGKFRITYISRGLEEMHRQMALAPKGNKLYDGCDTAEEMFAVVQDILSKNGDRIVE